MKRIISICILCSITIGLFAQATDLVVDNQTPGWLSSKINYGDQLTVKNLKVTGYINETDLKFIGTLMYEQSLNGCLDLSNVRVVKDPSNEFSLDNSISPDCLKGQIKKLIVPESIVAAGLNNVIVDSLYINWKTRDVSSANLGYNAKFKHLFLGENIDSIPRLAFSSCTTLQSIHFSSKTRYIGDGACNGNKYYYRPLSYINFEDLENLEYLGKVAFWHTNYTPDTLYVPSSLTNFDASVLSYKDGEHIFFPETLQSITYTNADPFYTSTGSSPIDLFDKKKVILHFKTQQPPSLPPFDSKVTLYVPKGAKSAYQAVTSRTIIEENPIESIDIIANKALELGETALLTVNLTPSNPDNGSIVTVDETGTVKGITPGQAYVYAVAEADENVKDSCLVTVIQHAESVALDTTNVRIFKIGDTYQLTAIVSPENTTDKTVIWESTNQSVCRVNNNGLVTAVGFGSSTIIATTQDRVFQALCVVLVKSMPNITSSAIEWDYNTFTYTGNAPQPTWRNTMTGLQVSATMPTLKKNVGTWEEVIPFTFKDEVDEVTLDIHYNYTIQPATLTIKALDATRNYGEENPTFSITYEGFVGGENESVLTKQPVIGCSANNESAPGEYPITVSGAEATNYQIQYVAGKLLVKDLESFKLIYMVDGAEYCRFTIKFKDPITPLTNIAREGYTFSGWSEIPTTMPSHDVVVVGSFTANKYKIRYYVGEQLWAEDEVEYGAKLTLRNYTPEDANRYAFAGWDGATFETMPAKDIEYHAMIVDGINGLNVDTNGIEAIYDGTGRKLSKMQRGVNVLRMKDGTKRKVFR